MTLTTYVLTAILSWGSARADRDVARYESVAADIAAVVNEPGESPMFRDDDARAKTALVLASIAFWESGISPRVDRGELLGDNGNAFSLWQLHDEQGGWTLDGDGWLYADAARRMKPAEWLASHRVYRAADFRGEAHRRDAARVALHVARASIQARAGLCRYSGEPGPCPKAAIRLNHAITWHRAHPFTP